MLFIFHKEQVRFFLDSYPAVVSFGGHAVVRVVPMVPSYTMNHTGTIHILVEWRSGHGGAYASYSTSPCRESCFRAMHARYIYIFGRYQPPFSGLAVTAARRCIYLLCLLWLSLSSDARFRNIRCRYHPPFSGMAVADRGERIHYFLPLP